MPITTHELEVGVLFADLRGFTSWSETHSSRDATDLVSRFYAMSNRVLTSDDAFVDFIGDQVMAIYVVDMPSLGARTADIMLAAARRLVDAAGRGVAAGWCRNAHGQGASRLAGHGRVEEFYCYRGRGEHGCTPSECGRRQRDLGFGKGLRGGVGGVRADPFKPLAAAIRILRQKQHGC